MLFPLLLKYSMHCYEKNFDMLENFVKSIETKPIEELTCEYEGFYKDMMEESIPKIMAQVQPLKDNKGK